ncbi:response regulator [Devosia chinhatensis]|uniref:Response regulatory domain-containing protein n=1 Tax=Devosia chinhatensis TaxID=429727 RepID=A0A0F5FGJ4_9HYPH|nr:response regulator [Devosia chinhatensis]KKB07317.1 hypothetical protein VE26_11020 [Devosia chinhatensis]
MLASKTVLVVETEIIIALSMDAVLRGLGAEDVLIATSPAEALRHTRDWGPIAMVILELETRRPENLSLAKSALEAGVLVLGVTADSQAAKGLAELPDIPMVVKPVPDETLEQAVIDLLKRNGQ